MPRPTLKKRADGRYRCKYKGHYFYGSSPSEAFAARDLFIRQGEGSAVPILTVEEYAGKWLPAHKAGVKKRTYDDYERTIRILVNAIGFKPIQDVTTTDIKSIYSTYFLGKSESAIHKAKMLYTAMWDTAMDDQIVTRNPCRSEQARPHHGTAGSHRALTADEDRLIASVQHPFRPAVMMMRYAGLRRGEVLALDIDRDVDFKQKIIHVRGAVRYDSNQAIISTTKTENGVRDVPLFDVLAEELKDHHGLVAPSAAGGIMSHTAFMRAWNSYKAAVETEMNGDSKRWFGRRKKSRMSDADRIRNWKPFTVRVHDFRHSYCTMLRDCGVDIKLAILWMGHADEKMILKIYDHVTDKRTKAAIQSVENSLKGVNLGVKSADTEANP